MYEPINRNFIGKHKKIISIFRSHVYYENTTLIRYVSQNIHIIIKRQLLLTLTGQTTYEEMEEPIKNISHVIMVAATNNNNTKKQ